MTRTATLLVALMLLAAGCSSNSEGKPSLRSERPAIGRQTPVPDAPAVVSGSLQMVGMVVVPVRGFITVRDEKSGQVILRAKTITKGRYRVDLPAGRYILTATSPNYEDSKGICVTQATGPIVAGDSIERDLRCSMK